MFTFDEAVSLWNDLNDDQDAFLYQFGELVLRTTPKGMPFLHTERGYFIRANNTVYTKSMFEAFNRICIKHDCTYRIQAQEDLKYLSIVFYKESKR